MIPERGGDIVNERIKKLRKTLGLTQQEFADRIGMKRNTIANYEINRNEPSNSVVSLVCREFNVQEEWLRTGKGEMFEAKPENRLDELSKEYNLDELDRQMVLGYLSLSVAEREVVKKYMLGAISRAEAKMQQSEPPSTTILGLTPSDTDSTEEAPDSDIEAQVERYRQHLIAKAKSKNAPRKAPKEMTREELHAELDRQLNEEEKTQSATSAFGFVGSGTATG